jgi:hypothetical protein
LTTFDESTSGKSLDFKYGFLGDGTDVWGKIHMNGGRVGEERRGEVRKQTDVPLQSQ